MTTCALKIVAVLDACVLYPPSLRDLIMWLGTVRAYGPALAQPFLVYGLGMPSPYECQFRR